MARESTRTSAKARFMPFAPVGGTMWAAVAGEKQPAVLHRLDHEAAHLRSHLFAAIGRA